jgi:ectoine hydroxylase-related dioxygenase (phytanoyl-CoA dioxygenase family)
MSATSAGAQAPRIVRDAGLVDTYRRDGLVVAPSRLADSRLAQMREALDRLLVNSAEIAPESLVCPHVPNGSRHPATEAAQWLELATAAAILDVVEQLIGPDIVLWGSQVFCKPARTGREVSWHQDGEYWPMRPLATCSAWITLDDTDADNGCMRYIPGSHAARRVLPHRDAGRPDLVLGMEVQADAFDPGAARDNVLAAGQFSLHDVFLVHGSGANRSGRRRAAFVVRYMPATSRYDRGIAGAQTQVGVSFSLRRRPLFLVRGTDRAGNDFETRHGEPFGLVPRLSDDDL